MQTGWTARAKKAATETITDKQPKATWAAVALLLLNLAGQAVQFYRNDFKTVVDAVEHNTATLKKLEDKMEDHEERITKVEKVVEEGHGADSLERAPDTVMRGKKRRR